jgi:hypothetical protein
VAVGREARALGHGVDLAPQQRNFAGPRRIGRGGEESDEAVLADHLAPRVIPLDADVVGVAVAVDGGPGVGLGHHQHGRRSAGEGAGRHGQRREARRLLPTPFAQHAQAAAGDQLQRQLAALAHQVVLAVAEQREVVVGQPLQEGAALRRFRGIDAGRRRRQFLGRLLQVRDHGGPVADRGAHVRQHPFDALAQRCPLLRVDEAVHLDVHPRLARQVRRGMARRHRLQHALGVALHREDGMHHQVQRQALAGELQRHGIHQEGHVVVDDLHDGVAGAPAVGARGRAEHPHLRDARLPLRCELPVRQQGAEQVLGRALVEVLHVDLAEVFAEKVSRGSPGARVGARHHAAMRSSRWTSSSSHVCSPGRRTVRAPRARQCHFAGRVCQNAWPAGRVAVAHKSARVSRAREGGLQCTPEKTGRSFAAPRDAHMSSPPPAETDKAPRAAPGRPRIPRAAHPRQGRDRRDQAADQPARPGPGLLARRRRALRGDRQGPGQCLSLHRARQPGGGDHQRHRRCWAWATSARWPPSR